MGITISQAISGLKQLHEYEHYYSALCPFHQDTKPSLLVFKDGWFKCMGCGRTGDWYSLQRKSSGWSTKSYTVEYETATYHIPTIENTEDFALHSHKVLVDFSESVGWYLRMRNLDTQVLPQKLGWYNGWYTIPVYNIDDTFTGVIMRAGKHIQAATDLRYVIKTHSDLYFPDIHLALTGKYLVVTFGILDAITLCKLRIPACSSIHGKSIKPASLTWARKPIVFFPDRDEAMDVVKYYKSLGWRGRIAKFDWTKIPDTKDGKELKDPNDLHSAGYDVEMRNAIEQTV